MDPHYVGYAQATLLPDWRDWLKDFSLHKTFVDKGLQGKASQQQLCAMLAFVQAGDRVVCPSLKMFGRSPEERQTHLCTAVRRGIDVCFLKERLTLGADFRLADPGAAELAITLLVSYPDTEVARSNIKSHSDTSGSRSWPKQRQSDPGFNGAQMLTPENSIDLLERFARGEDATLLAKRFGVATRTVYAYLYRTGHRRGRRYPLQDSKAAELRQRFLDGENKHNLALRFGIPSLTVNRYLKAAGIAHTTPQLVGTRAESLCKRFQTGTRIGDLAREYEVHPKTISLCLKRHGLRKQRKLTTAEIKSLCQRRLAGEPRPNLAREFGVSVTTVDRHTKQCRFRLS